jgi:hypothetical protein
MRVPNLVHKYQIRVEVTNKDKHTRLLGATTFSIMTLIITTFSITTLSIMGLFATLSIIDC